MTREECDLTFDANQGRMHVEENNELEDFESCQLYDRSENGFDQEENFCTGSSETMKEKEREMYFSHVAASILMYTAASNVITSDLCLGDEKR